MIPTVATAQRRINIDAQRRRREGMPHIRRKARTVPLPPMPQSFPPLGCSRPRASPARQLSLLPAPIPCLWETYPRAAPQAPHSLSTFPAAGPMQLSRLPRRGVRQLTTPGRLSLTPGFGRILNELDKREVATTNSIESPRAGVRIQAVAFRKLVSRLRPSSRRESCSPKLRFSQRGCLQRSANDPQPAIYHASKLT